MSSRIDQSLSYLNNLKKIPVEAGNVDCLFSTKSFKTELLKQIEKAKKRIYLTALYLEADEAGEDILNALYLAKKNTPELDIVVLIDYHRAQRGLIGSKKSSATNTTWYQEVARVEGLGISIVGIPVKRKELFGVQHLKGFIFDDEILYSGASFNNIYLNQHDKYRLDRYWLIENKKLANSMVEFLQNSILNTAAVASLNTETITPFPDLKVAHKKLSRALKESRYSFIEEDCTDQLSIVPISGLGARKNRLNKTIRKIFQSATKEVVLFTPYFNLPKALAKDINALLKRGVELTIVVGDKTANDFFIPESEPFRTISALPYLYECNLKQFCKTHQTSIAQGQLNIHLWKAGNNSFHLKGIYSDKRFVMLTGHNLNPRAWRLDLENGLLIDDPKQQLEGLLQDELSEILINTTRINEYTDITDISLYPENVKKLLMRMRRLKADKLVKGLI
ncbi:MAG: CDP-diacylglycerol--serine O-phosphatidyltransferase [Psychromonas sp.]